MHKENESNSERGLLTTTEAAHYLGVKPSYLYKMIDASGDSLLQAGRQTLLLFAR